MAAVNCKYAQVGNDGEFVLGLLAVRADDHGRLSFVRGDLVRFYGIEPTDIDGEPLHVALDRLILLGFVAVTKAQGRPHI